MTLPGIAVHPLRVAIVGAGPAGYYAADHLLKHEGVVVEVDMIDRLPTPYGLVRVGVAPDHQKIKSVTAAFDKVAANPRFRFFGGIELGKDIEPVDLRQHYHQIVYATGTSSSICPSSGRRWWAWGTSRWTWPASSAARPKSWPPPTSPTMPSRPCR